MDPKSCAILVMIGGRDFNQSQFNRATQAKRQVGSAFKPFVYAAALVSGLTLADTLWFGPAETWNKELPNYPYIEFWHRFDLALAAEGIGGMGPELLGDDAWEALFSSGPLVENGDIRMTMRTNSQLVVWPEDVDQLATGRPVGALGDIGAIELEP